MGPGGMLNSFAFSILNLPGLSFSETLYPYAGNLCFKDAQVTSIKWSSKRTLFLKAWSSTSKKYKGKDNLQ